MNYAVSGQQKEKYKQLGVAFKSLPFTIDALGYTYFCKFYKNHLKWAAAVLEVEKV